MGEVLPHPMLLFVTGGKRAAEGVGVGVGEALSSLTEEMGEV